MMMTTAGAAGGTQSGLVRSQGRVFEYDGAVQRDSGRESTGGMPMESDADGSGMGTRNAEAAKLEAEARKLSPEKTKLEAEARRQRHGTVTDDAKFVLALFVAGLGALKVAESLGWLSGGNHVETT